MLRQFLDYNFYNQLIICMYIANMTRHLDKDVKFLHLDFLDKS